MSPPSAKTPSDMNSTASTPLPKISPSTGPTGSPPPLNPNNNGLATSTVIGITIGVVLFFVFLLVIGLFFYFRDQERRRRPVSFRRMQRPLGKNMSSLNWQTRRQIAIGSARGLVYLHEDCNPKIIHRDIKASNILLDENFEPKVADFGLAKFSSDTETHISTRVMGTFGYMAPEYASSGRLTAKSDVFSFGVVLLELITGRKPNDKRKKIF